MEGVGGPCRSAFKSGELELRLRDTAVGVMNRHIVTLNRDRVIVRTVCELRGGIAYSDGTETAED